MCPDVYTTTGIPLIIAAVTAAIGRGDLNDFEQERYAMGCNSET